MQVLIPRVTDMHDGTFRPEIVIDDGSTGDIIFLEPMPSISAAWERACDAIEIVPGDWTDSGNHYVVP